MVEVEIEGEVEVEVKVAVGGESEGKCKVEGESRREGRVCLRVQRMMRVMKTRLTARVGVGITGASGIPNRPAPSISPPMLRLANRPVMRAGNSEFRSKGAPPSPPPPPPPCGPRTPGVPILAMPPIPPTPTPPIAMSGGPYAEVMNVCLSFAGRRGASS